MAGIYIHIPFCRQACHYCDFHFSTNLKNQNELVDILCQEIIQRKNYIDERIETIYFGGGTPSLLTSQQLEKILVTIDDNYEISPEAEITLEGNPEDLDFEKTSEIRKLGINRLSIGIQTFDDEKLKWMNRIHSSGQAISAFENARAIGFENISLDLIYALPEAGFDFWKSDLKKMVELQPEHISLYGLTIEEKTVFGNWSNKGKLIEVPEDEAATQYLHAIDFLKSSGYEHYEVSNFGKPGYSSRHNTSYWQGIPYLGIGPGAHSFDGKSRQLNVRNNQKYIRLITSGESYYDTEQLSQTQLLNERILTSLRTHTGIDLHQLKSEFTVDLKDEYADVLSEFERNGFIILMDGFIRLTPNGFLVADEVALRLFFPE